jgi:hypothetical protein
MMQDEQEYLEEIQTRVFPKGIVHNPQEEVR